MTTIELIRKIKYQRLTPIQKIFIDVFNNCFVVNQDNRNYYVFNSSIKNPFFTNGYINFGLSDGDFILSEYFYWWLEYNEILCEEHLINDEIKFCLNNYLNINVSSINKLHPQYNYKWASIEEFNNYWGLLK